MKMYILSTSVGPVASASAAVEEMRLGFLSMALVTTAGFIQPFFSMMWLMLLRNCYFI